MGDDGLGVDGLHGARRYKLAPAAVKGPLAPRPWPGRQRGMMAADSIPAGIADPARHSDARGLVARTASITPQLLQAAYGHGVFPWTDNPVGWFCPPWRGVLLPDQAHFPRNLPRLGRKAQFAVRADTAFAAVVAGCARAHRHAGIWITPRFARAYLSLHQMGLAHSVEVWQAGELVGGLYGVQVGGVFCAESMFAGASHAGKVALQALVAARAQLGIRLVDVQVVGHVTSSLGAREVPRQAYLEALVRLRNGPGPRPWPEAL